MTPPRDENCVHWMIATSQISFIEEVMKGFHGVDDCERMKNLAVLVNWKGHRGCFLKSTSSFDLMATNVHWLFVELNVEPCLIHYM